jgi:hypothetical protein
MGDRGDDRKSGVRAGRQDEGVLFGVAPIELARLVVFRDEDVE